MIIILFLIINTAISSALQITEVELNPSGSDTNKEWIELYSDSSLDLSQYTFTNGDNQHLQFNISFSGYYMLQLEKQWLDNSNESITISSSDFQLSTPILADSKNDEQTWQLCNQDWKFELSTPNKENSCDSTTNSRQNLPQNNISQTQEKNNQVQEPYSNTHQQIQFQNEPLEQTNSNQQEKIVLNPTQISQESIQFYSPEYKIRIWISYIFSAICIIILILVVKNKL